MLLKALSYLPLSMLYALAWVLFFPAYYFPGYRRAVVGKNLKASFPEKTEVELKNIAKGFYRHLLQTAVEVIASHRLSAEDFQKRGVVIGAEQVNAFHSQGQPVLILLGHCGNWEWANFICGAHLHFVTDPVYKAIKNKGLNRFMMDLRSRGGAEPIEKDSLARAMVRRRKSQRNIGMLADQVPALGTEKSWQLFLGQDTAFYTGPGQLASFTQWPVFYVRFHRISRGQYEGRFILLSDGSRGAEEVNMAYAAALEENIRAYPEQWLWSHKRWKYSRK